MMMIEHRPVKRCCNRCSREVDHGPFTIRTLGVISLTKLSTQHFDGSTHWQTTDSENAAASKED